MAERERQKKAGQRTDKKNKQQRDATSARKSGGKAMRLPKDESNLGDRPEPRVRGTGGRSQ
jgi:hypothetical protein